MKSILAHKGFGYAIHTHNGLDWVWKIYPRVGDGHPVCGSTRGTEQDAISACVEAIELKITMRPKRNGDALNYVRFSI
jgi:hypothetical protein